MGIEPVASLNYKHVRKRENFIAHAGAFTISCLSEDFLSITGQERHNSMLIFIAVISISP